MRMRLKTLALARPRYGYQRLHILLRREGWMVNHKRVLRLYCGEGLTPRIPRRKRKYASWVRVPLPEPTQPKELTSLDFMSDALADGRRFRILTVLDLSTGVPGARGSYARADRSGDARAGPRRRPARRPARPETR
jgi:putative transposase